MKLSILIPVYNEEKTIAEIIRRVEAVVLDGLEKEIIVIDDGSSDDTSEILKNFVNRVKVVRHPQNQGKGAAIALGLWISIGEIIIIQDADLEYDPADYPRILAPLLAGRADAVFGSRLLSVHPHRVLYFWHYLGNKFLTTLSNIFTNLNLSDMETGLKAFSRRTAELIKNEITSKRFEIEPELTALMARHHLRLYEVGISYYGRTYAEGKKITWKDGLIAIYYIIKFNLFK